MMESLVVVGLYRWHFGIVFLRMHVHDFVSVVAEMVAGPAVAVLLLVSIIFAVAVGEKKTLDVIHGSLVMRHGWLFCRTARAHICTH